MKGVVEGQCGQQNALVGLANTFGQSNQRIAPSSAASAQLLPQSSLGEQMANEFLRSQSRAVVAPTSFSLKAMQKNLPPVAKSTNLAMNWSNEFQPKQNQLANQWSQQYAGSSSSSQQNFDTAWRQAAIPLSAASSSSLVGQQQQGASMWSAEFLDNIDTSLQQQQQQQGSAQQWADDFLASPDTWNGSSHNEQFESTWNQIRRDFEEGSEQATPTTTTTTTDQYTYQDDNPFSTMSDPLSQGDALMRQGDIGNAMLAYEAAVRNNPQDAKAWCRLGLSHAENEKDQSAMTAFRKCLEIEPTNKEALLAMSVSMANEGQENEALHQLDKWMSSYLGNDASQVTSTPPMYSSFLDDDIFHRVEARFLDAARQQAGEPDPDLQNALGILYNLNRNFVRAVDSLKLAISRNTDDARLWNRLGATLANGDRTAEAISAYREALQRYPTYVRARYNLGISCMQLTSYREALTHFASALELQKGGTDASTIWSTMRSAAIRTPDAPESLLRAVEVRDLAAVKSILQTLP